MIAVLIKLGLAPALMVASTLAARRWGPTLGGIVAAFPAIVAPLLLVTDLIGMAGFIAFCGLVALMVVPDGGIAAFAVATGAALLIQAALAYGRAVYPAARNSAGRSGEASASACFRPSESRSAA